MSTSIFSCKTLKRVKRGYSILINHERMTLIQLLAANLKKQAKKIVNRRRIMRFLMQNRPSEVVTYDNSILIC